MPVIIVLARDPPSRHFGRVFGYFGHFWRDGHPSKTLLNDPKNLKIDGQF